jgi:hypothetical protein
VPGAPAIADLNLPPIVGKLEMEDSGLIVIAGPAASGKTTTVAALLDHVNATRARHIVTLEDPIEVLSDKQSLVSQVARVDPGSFFVVTFSSGGPDPGASNEWIRGVDSEWEAWDGESWTATHVLLDGAYVDEEPTTHALDGDGTYAIGDIALPADGDVRFLAPPTDRGPPGVAPGVHRRVRGHRWRRSPCRAAVRAGARRRKRPG